MAIRMGRGAALLLIGVAFALGIAAAARAVGGAPSPRDGAQTLTVQTTDRLRFTPDTLTIKAGQPVRLTLDNGAGNLVHGFAIKGTDVQIVAPPHTRTTGTFTIVAPGTYEFYCAQPAFEEAGMVGTLTVQ
jgi:heme/copper-type cytochrome/quinol oxidase subunit 2